MEQSKSRRTAGIRGSRPLDRALASAGAVLAALAVGLAAYASHAVGPGAGMRLGLASAFAFGHGLALAALAPRSGGRLATLALCLLLAGVLLFAGSLAGAHFLGWGTRLAPLGGGLLMLGWLVHATSAWKA